MDRILFLGDLHASLAPLQEMLVVSGYRPDRDILLPLGDVINRGPDSASLLRLLKSLGVQPILGNHEAALLRYLSEGELRPWVRTHEGCPDLLAAHDKNELLDYIRTWPVWREGPDWLAIHAGLHPSLPLSGTPQRFLQNVRTCREDGSTPTSEADHADPSFLPWHHFYKGEKTVFYGHWAKQGLHLTERTKGLDSGCFYGRSLSAWWYPEGRLLQVPGLRS